MNVKNLAKGFSKIRHFYPLGVSLILGLVILSYCGPVRISFPIRGRIIDSETKRPIPGAVVRFDRTGICPRYIHGSDHYPKRPLETVAGTDGSFKITGIWSAIPCFKTSWFYELSILAVGYLPTL